MEKDFIEKISYILGFKYLRYELGFKLYCWRFRKEIEYLFSILEDEDSKKVLRIALKGRPLRKNDLYKTIYDSNNEEFVCGVKIDTSQYFPKDIISLSEEEVFVDCGAYIGDTSINFTCQNQAKFKKIHIFELDPVNYGKLTEIISKNLFKHLDKIQMYNIGLYNQRLTSRIDIKGTSSRITDINSKSLNAESSICEFVVLDDFLSEEEKKEITFIKMDIEGAELKALEGMKDTISRFKPKLAICIYHSARELIEIPLFVKSLNTDYKFYIRHHSPNYCETVLYAI